MNRRDKASLLQLGAACSNKQGGPAPWIPGVRAPKGGNAGAGLRRFRVCEMAPIALRQNASPHAGATFRCGARRCRETSRLLNALALLIHRRGYISYAPHLPLAAPPPRG